MLISMCSIHGSECVQTPPESYRGRHRSKLDAADADRRDGYKEPVEDVDSWGESIEKLLESRSGQLAFQEFLKSEYSEENILFWLACEEYKKITSVPEMISMANQIYTEFVQTDSPRQVNIDSGTRSNITNNISEPNLNSFDAAQKHIFSLMSRDCYPRFLKSDIYRAILQKHDNS
ncbi:regulator of G-protein signaling 21 isoform X1 [Misgurnus anguillicaudatus]|uniref:regulator of G-protein signaling 21 isoform X1 n=1 Tax=Misgurnus anguillicaudatus TaxID=75329 RepID=UPI002434EF11|nr:regulator of G-protein signaling 21 isoform X1 [Misgurnus anguillicaudatus]